VHQRDTTEAFVMADLQVAAIREYLREPNVPDPVKQTLRELAEELDRVHDLQTKLTAQRSRIRIIEAEQKRIKGNMRDLDYTNELYQRYLKMLETTEDELATTSDVIHSTEQELAEVKGRIDTIAPRGKDPFGN
jgi:chromosome segregation ATPase